MTQDQIDRFERAWEDREWLQRYAEQQDMLRQQRNEHALATERRVPKPEDRGGKPELTGSNS
jgi:hypothetical protein